MRDPSAAPALLIALLALGASEAEVHRLARRPVREVFRRTLLLHLVDLGSSGLFVVGHRGEVDVIGARTALVVLGALPFAGGALGVRALCLGLIRVPLRGRGLLPVGLLVRLLGVRSDEVLDSALQPPKGGILGLGL
jgi:hypothetical protein